MSRQMVDVAIIGGSFAGCTAALQLGRARRAVIMFDTGQPRNRFASEGHGFPGMDGVAPRDIQARMQADALNYSTVSHSGQKVTSIAGQVGAFVLTTAAGPRVEAKRVILAHGNRDILPEISGVRDGWGQSVLQCPYCHGYEVADRPTGVLLSGEPSLHQAKMLRDWTGDLTIFTNGSDFAADALAELKGLGMRIVRDRIDALRRRGPRSVAQK